MPNGMHDGATPRGARHGAFVHGEHTVETIADGRKAAALNDTATGLLLEAVRAQIDMAGKLRRGSLRPAEAEAQRVAIKAQVACRSGDEGGGCRTNDRQPHRRSRLGGGGVD